MKILTFRYSTFAICPAFAMLVSCSTAAQPQAGAIGAMPQAALVHAKSAHGQSWMKPSTSGGDLLYVSLDSAGYNLYVFSYPQGSLVQKLSLSNVPDGECSDSRGNVFIFERSVHEFVEYAHGGSSPINTLSLSPDVGQANCAVDPATNNLAVPIGNTVYVFINEQGTPKTYQDSNHGFTWCGYDDNGNLFLDGGATGGSNKTVTKLNVGTGSFTDISVSKSGNYKDLQWDGEYLAIDNFGTRPLSNIYRVQVSGSMGKVVATVSLKGGFQARGDTWIGGGNVVVPIGEKEIGFWNYPAGGKPIKVMPRTDFPHPITGMTVSVAPSK